MGGDFGMVDRGPAKGIARWNGINWESLGEGLDSPYTHFSGVAHDMIDWRGELVVGGTFYSAGRATNIAHLAVWSGSEWRSLSSPFYGGGIRSTVVGPDDLLYVSGRDHDVEGLAARYDGREWRTILSGLMNPPNLAFDHEGALLLDGVERWLPPGISVPPGDPPPGGRIVEVFQIFPNPTTGESTLHLVAASDGEVTVVLYDALGREVEAPYREYLWNGEQRLVKIDLGPRASGVYYGRVRTPRGSMTRAFVRL